MIGNKIKELRTKEGLTQKELADKLYVSYQAVSRWENNEVEPSIQTVKQIAQIFNVSLDYILENEHLEEQVVKEPEVIVKHTIGVCKYCEKVIDDANDFVKKTHYYRSGPHEAYYHKKCYEKMKCSWKDESMTKVEGRRKKAITFGIIISIIVTSIVIATGINNKQYYLLYASPLIAYASFALCACLILDNSFIGDMVLRIFSWGFFKMPGIIFSFDINGIVAFILIKLTLFIIALMIALSFGVLAIGLGLLLAIFAFPFAMRKSFDKPLENNYIINID